MHNSERVSIGLDYRGFPWAKEYVRIDNNKLTQILYGVEQDEIDYMFSIDI